jgi:hypothetical protein
MRIRKKKGGAEPSIRETAKSQTVKVQSYYTVSSRDGGKPEIDMGKRGAKRPKPTNHKSKGDSRNQLLRIGIILVAIALLVYVVRLSTVPVVIIDSEPSLGRSAIYQEGISDILGSSLLNKSSPRLTM